MRFCMKVSKVNIKEGAYYVYVDKILLEIFNKSSISFPGRNKNIP